ncbi:MULTISPECIES: hypothetical protein [unclassified Bradyrhizobium]|uniref:hypothetical protein n=1 Tax=unclassified Bradyrhizobium TaxID=2631580 RepID=UPI003D1D40D9
MDRYSVRPSFLLARYLSNAAQAAQMAAVAGCKVADSVSKNITILVVGDQDLRLAKGQEKSSKHRKAEAMIADGVAIRIVRESDFLMMVE